MKKTAIERIEAKAQEREALAAKIREQYEAGTLPERRRFTQNTRGNTKN